MVRFSGLLLLYRQLFRLLLLCRRLRVLLGLLFGRHLHLLHLLRLCLWLWSLEPPLRDLPHLILHGRRPALLVQHGLPGNQLLDALPHHLEYLVLSHARLGDVAHVERPIGRCIPEAAVRCWRNVETQRCQQGRGLVVWLLRGARRLGEGLEGEQGRQVGDAEHHRDMKAGAPVGRATCDVPELLIDEEVGLVLFECVAELGHQVLRFGDECLEVCVGLQRHHAQMVVLVDPHQHAFVVGHVQTTAVRPVTADARRLAVLRIWWSEEHLVDHQVVTVGSSHLGQREVAALQLPRQPTQCIGNHRLHLATLAARALRRQCKSPDRSVDPQSGGEDDIA
mmetsp:Transcript_14984/g.35711  ORF Transcript_14984/g.35711 Transcript_14984/m.35711 type:complete len:337 (+) Transcript_14984:219-1229(+)